ncbi:uncharacterized protein LOC143041084 isoform X2 [Oratosquilla oratoria]
MVLVQAGADLTALNSDGDLPYDITEDEVTLKYLENEMLKQGITDDIIDKKRISEEVQMLQDIETMLQTGQSLDWQGKVGETMLHVAVANAYNSVVQMLLENNASVNLEDEDKWQPIHVAAHWNNLEALELLVEHDANLRALTKFGETPLDLTDDPSIKAHILQMIDDRPELYAMKTHSLCDNDKDKPLHTQNLVKGDGITDKDDVESKLNASRNSKNYTNLNSIPANLLVNTGTLELTSDRRSSMRDAKNKAPLIRGNSIKDRPKPQSPCPNGFSLHEPTSLESFNPSSIINQHKEDESISTHVSNLSQSTNLSDNDQTLIHVLHPDAQKFTNVNNNNNNINNNNDDNNNNSNNDNNNTDTQSTDAVTGIQSEALKASDLPNPLINCQTQWTNPLANKNVTTKPLSQKLQLTNSDVIGKSEINSLSSAESQLTKEPANIQQPTNSPEHTPSLTNPLAKNNTESTKLMQNTQSQPTDSSVSDQSQSNEPLLIQQNEISNLNPSNQIQPPKSPNSQNHPTKPIPNERQHTDPLLNPSQVLDNKPPKSSKSYNNQTVDEESERNDLILKKQSNGYPAKKLRPSPKSHRAPDPPKGTLLDLKRQRQLARTFEDLPRQAFSSFNPGVPSATQMPLSPQEYSTSRPRSSSAGMNDRTEKRDNMAHWCTSSNASTFNSPPSPTAIRYSFKSDPADYILGPSIIKRQKKCIIM